MKLGSATLAYLLVVLGMHSASAATPSILAYYESNSQSALKADRSYLNQVAADLYAVDIGGQVSGTLPAALKSVAGAAHIKLFATISNFGANGFSLSIGHAVLTNSVVQARALAGIKALAANPAYAGVNIDFENLNKKDRAAYSAFVAAVAQVVHSSGALAVISVPAALSNDPTDGWTGAFDYAAIGAACDIFQLMTYDENGPWGAPGPVAGLDWVSQSLAYTLTVVPAAKISLGMPAYGYDWDLTNNTGVQIAKLPCLR